MTARTDTATSTADREIVTTRVFDAPPDRVFQAWKTRSGGASKTRVVTISRSAVLVAVSVLAVMFYPLCWGVRQGI
jgi:hypothetical protein